MKVRRQARIESAILLALGENDAASVAELANRIDASRASTSRAFAGLTRKGLVQTDGRRRSLTLDGRQAARDLLEPSAIFRRAAEHEQRQIRTLVDRAQVKHVLGNTAMFDMVGSLQRKLAFADVLATAPAGTMRLSAISPVTDFAKLADTTAVGRIAALQLDALVSIEVPSIAAMIPDDIRRGFASDLAARFAEMPMGVFDSISPAIDRAQLGVFAEIGASIADRDLTRFTAASSLIGRELAAVQTLALGRGAGAAMDALRLQVDALGPAMLGRQDWVSVLSESVGLSSKILDDVSAITAFTLPDTVQDRQRLGLVSAAIDPVLVANRDNAAAELGWIGTRSPRERESMFITPSVTTRGLTRVARVVVDPSEADSGALLPDPGDMFEILEARGMNASCRDLRGARDAIDRLPDGWVKTASHLLREAMREVLLVLAPDDQIENPQRVRVTRKMRIRHAVGGASSTLTSVIDSTAEGWDQMVAFLSAEAHNDGDARLSRDGMVGGVVAVEGLIRMLIAAHDIARHTST